MIVLSHRGYWKEPGEKNTPAAFQRSFDLGFGTETDVRDRSGELVISHDPPTGGEMLFTQFLDLVGDCDLPLAINVKADGLAARIREAFEGRPLTRWFVFDMSFPDTLQQLKHGNPVYRRVSEHEPSVPFLEKSAGGIWLDSFDSDWWLEGGVRPWLALGQPVCLVSPELHGRDPQAAWSGLALDRFNELLMICTDRPEEARGLLGGMR